MRGLLSFSLATAGLSAPDDAYNRMHIAYISKGGRQEEEDIDDLALGFPEKPETICASPEATAPTRESSRIRHRPPPRGCAP